MAFRFGIDLGGTKIELIGIDEAGTERLRRRVPTPVSNYRATVSAIVELVSAAQAVLKCEDTDDCSIGVGIPGTLSAKTGLVKNANSTCLIGQPLQDDLETMLKRSVRIANDADCFALSEATDGAGQGRGIVFGVILGTGVGGGLVVNGKIVRGPNAITGEWGHNPLPWPDADLGELPGPPCYCGKTGCNETFLSGPGLLRDTAPRPDLKPWTSAQHIVTAGQRGDVTALSCLTRYYKRLAKGLAAVINVIDPDVIVLGGGLSNIASIYEKVPALWGEYVFSDTVLTKLAKNKHGDSSGVRGAAWLWPQQP